MGTEIALKPKNFANRLASVQALEWLLLGVKKGLVPKALWLASVICHVMWVREKSQEAENAYPTFYFPLSLL